MVQTRAFLYVGYFLIALAIIFGTLNVSEIGSNAQTTVWIRFPQ